MIRPILVSVLLAVVSLGAPHLVWEHDALDSVDGFVVQRAPLQEDSWQDVTDLPCWQVCLGVESRGECSGELEKLCYGTHVAWPLWRVEPATGAYKWRVVAYNEGGRSEPSNEVASRTAGLVLTWEEL